jgi:hypothetical protein
LVEEEPLPPPPQASTVTEVTPAGHVQVPDKLKAIAHEHYFQKKAIAQTSLK